jgi:hypothetical protein
MKRFLIILLIILLTFAGCSGNIEIGSIENNTSKEMSASYTKFSGTKQTNLTVEAGKPIDISADIVTKKGSLNVYIYQKGEKSEANYNYSGTNIKTTNFTVTLSDPGDYIIKVTARNHKGSFSFTW